MYVRIANALHHSGVFSWSFCGSVDLALLAAMPELKVNTLKGRVLTLDVTMTETVKQLKAMLVEELPCEDPIDQRIAKLEVFLESNLLDDTQTLDAIGLDDESEIGVVYTRNEFEAARKEDVNAQGFFKVNIPHAVTKVSQGAFGFCSEMVQVTIPCSVTSIEDSAFEGCISLESIDIPDSVTSIGYKAFARCTALQNVDIPDSVWSIGTDAFKECSAVTSIVIPYSVTIIEDCAFSTCSSLENIDIPDSVTSIGFEAFFNCIALTSIDIPDSVTRIGINAFAGCTALQNINIPDSVTSIRRSVFARCRSLRSIVIPDSVTSIEDRAFEGCSSLESINIPDSVTSIGVNAFAGCSSLPSIKMPNSVGTDKVFTWRLYWKTVERGCQYPDTRTGNSHLATFRSFTDANWLPCFRYRWVPPNRSVMDFFPLMFRTDQGSRSGTFY